MPTGGARAGAGAKKYQHRITTEELRNALETQLGMPWQQHLAEINGILFNKFKQGSNVKEFITFNENMNKRLLQEQTQEVNVNQLTMTTQEVDDRINNLTTRLMLSTKKEENDDSNATE